MKNAKESSCCGSAGTHCWVRVLLVFLLGALVGGITVGLLFFYDVFPPETFGASTFRDYSRAVPTQVELKTVEPIQFDIRGFIPPTGTMEDPMSFIPPTGT
jgi:hypothetical protein